MDIDKTISDEEVLNNIEKRNNAMQVIVNENLSVVERQSGVLEDLFLENMEYYRLARERGLRTPSFSFMRAVSSILDYTIDKDLKATKIIRLTKNRRVL